MTWPPVFRVILVLFKTCREKTKEEEFRVERNKRTRPFRVFDGRSSTTSAISTREERFGTWTLTEFLIVFFAESKLSKQSSWFWAPLRIVHTLSFPCLSCNTNRKTNFLFFFLLRYHLVEECFNLLNRGSLRMIQRSLLNIRFSSCLCKVHNKVWPWFFEKVTTLDSVQFIQSEEKNNKLNLQPFNCSARWSVKAMSQVRLKLVY